MGKKERTISPLPSFVTLNRLALVGIGGDAGLAGEKEEEEVEEEEAKPFFCGESSLLLFFLASDICKDRLGMEGWMKYDEIHVRKARYSRRKAIIRNLVTLLSNLKST